MCNFVEKKLRGVMSKIIQKLVMKWCFQQNR